MIVILWLKETKSPFFIIFAPEIENYWTSCCLILRFPVRYRCLRRTMIIYQKKHTSVCIKRQHAVIPTTFLHMEMENQLHGFKIIFAQMVHIDGIITWRPQSKMLLCICLQSVSCFSTINCLAQLFYCNTFCQKIFNEKHYISPKISSCFGYSKLFHKKYPFCYSEIKLEEAAVLHYTYPKFSDLTSRRDRCGCKPTKEDVKRCFMLDFDRAVSA